MQRIIIFILFVGSSLHWNCAGYRTYGTEDTSAAKAAIQELKTGTLIVRLTSNAKKIEALNAALQRDPSPRTQALLDSTLVETHRRNKVLRNALSELYTFSEVRFIYDTATTALLDGQRSGIFLDANLQIDPSLRFDGPFYLTKFGKPDTNFESFSEGVTILNDQLNVVSAPFPAYIIPRTKKGKSRGVSMSIGAFFYRLINKDATFDQNYAEGVAYSLDREFRQFYTRYN